MGQLRTANNRRNRALRHAVARAHAAPEIATKDAKSVVAPKTTKSKKAAS